MKKSIIVLSLFLFIPGICGAATIFLDNNTGVTNGCANYNPDTRTCGSGTNKAYSDAYTASQALNNGDTLSIRAGEYYSDVTGKSGYIWVYGSMTVRASNVTIKNYNDETVWLKGGASRVTPAAHPNNALFLYGNNITVDGLNLYGGTIVSGSNNTIKNCDLSGGFDHQAPWNTSTPDAAWPNVIRFIESSNALVQNCKLHDNVKPPAGGNDSNMGLVMHERDDNTIVENCEFYNPCASFGYLKYQSGYNGYAFHGTGVHATYRYNLFRAGTNGGSGGWELAAGLPNAPNPVQNEYFYQNIFIGCQSGFLDEFVASGTLFAFIYNNTFYNSPKALFNWSGNDVYNWFNNVIINDTAGNFNISLDGSTGTIWSYMDYNNYFASGVVASWYQNWSTRASTLSAWQNYTSGLGSAKDTHSVNTNPNFINASGTFSQASDFQRTSYPQNGRGGSWRSVMGAYVTGTENIGVTGAQSPTLLSAPQNFRIQQ